MKKIIRILAIIVVICLTFTCFTGCDYVTEMRESYAYYNANKDIVYNDNIYKALPTSPEIYFEYPASDLYVTEGEAPVLLAEILGEWCELSNNQIYISTGSGKIYCREDKFNSVNERIENGFEVKKYLYEYELEQSENLDFFEYYPFETKKYIFSEEENAAIDDILKNVTPIAEETQNLSSYADYYISVYGCSDDLLFAEETFYIIADKKEFYIEIADEYYNSTVRKVPAKYNKLFKELTKEYVESYGSMY